MDFFNIPKMFAYTEFTNIRIVCYSIKYTFGIIVKIDRKTEFSTKLTRTLRMQSKNGWDIFCGAEHFVATATVQIEKQNHC